MLNVLLESNAARTRRSGGALASTMVHGALIAAAVALTIPRRIEANLTPDKEPPITYIVPELPKPTTVVHDGGGRPVWPKQVPPQLPAVQFVDPQTPSIEVPTPSVLSATTGIEIGPGLPLGTMTGAPTGISGPPGGILDEHLVDRAPRLLGRAEPPVFPAALRASGRGGRVVVQFVVDTLGRAEMSDFRVVEANHPLFADAVRSALPRYRFSPGEAGGRRVRTLVQLPFDFTLVR
jgi:protein TonB